MDENILSARVIDTFEICEKTSSPKFLGFLSCEQAVFAAKILENRKANFEFFGGCDSCERVMLGCFPETIEKRQFPITAITFKFRKADKLSHRDFLGTLMGLGIKRESVGDILVEEARAVVFVAREIENFILTQVEKVGRTGVTLEKGYTEPLPERKALSECSVTVASGRLDCVVGALIGISRSAAIEKINSGLVSVNSCIVQKCTKAIVSGDIVSVRGNGKYIIDSLNDRTKKNRVVLKYKKYT